MTTPTISEAARLELVRALKEAQQIADERQSPVVEIGGFWVSEALSALTSVHPAPKEGETPEVDRIFNALLEVLGEYDKKRVYFSDVANACYSAKCDLRSLELRLSEAKRELGRSEEQYREHLNSLRSQLKTANELLGLALGNHRQLEGEAAFLFTPEFEDAIRTHLNQQNK